MHRDCIKRNFNFKILIFTFKFYFLFFQKKSKSLWNILKSKISYEKLTSSESNLKFLNWLISVIHTSIIGLKKNIRPSFIFIKYIICCFFIIFEFNSLIVNVKRLTSLSIFWNLSLIRASTNVDFTCILIKFLSKGL